MTPAQEYQYLKNQYNLLVGAYGESIKFLNGAIDKRQKQKEEITKKLEEDTDLLRRNSQIRHSSKCGLPLYEPEPKKEATWIERIMNSFKTNTNMLKNLKNALTKSAELEESETKLVEKLKKAVYDKQVAENINLEKRLEEIKSMGEAKGIKKMITDFFSNTFSPSTKFVPKVDRLIKSQFSKVDIKTPKDLLYVNPLLKMIRIADDLAVTTNAEMLSTVNRKIHLKSIILKAIVISLPIVLAKLRQQRI